MKYHIDRCDCRSGECLTPILCAEDAREALRRMSEAQEGARMLRSIDPRYDSALEHDPVAWQALNGGNE